MVNPIAWIHASKPLTYAEAVSLAASLGGRLLVKPDFYGLSSLRDILDHEEDSAWINGGPDPSHILEQTLPDLLVEYVGPNPYPDPNDSRLAPANVRGTAGNDQFVGGPGPGYTLRAGAGDDLYYGVGGGTIDLGAGNDRVIFGQFEAYPWGVYNFNVGATLIYDGDGADYIDAPRWDGETVLRAAIDGDNDTYLNLSRLTYTSDTAGITAIVSGPEGTGTASGSGIGTDTLGNIHEIVGGSGNDRIEGFARIQGGSGNDYLAPTAYAEGGDGNDTLVTSGLGRVELRGGAGTDTLLLRHSASVSGGAGSDNFVFEGGSGVTIVDFTAGDWLDLSAITDLTVQQLFSTGTLKVVRDKGYTDLIFDDDGTAGPQAPFELATLKGVFTQAYLDDWIIC